MSRNRYDRDDDRDYYARSWRGGGGGREREDRYDAERGSGALDSRSGYDDPYSARRGGADASARYYGRDIDGRGSYAERADYRPDERRYSNYSGGRNEGRSREYDRYDDS